MFTGIIETFAKVVDIQRDKTNIHFVFESELSHELKIDQSVAHNGVCLTVTALHTNTQVNTHTHTVTAIDETLQKTNLGHLKVGSMVNIERCLRADGRFDGHFVQGHVDETAICTEVLDTNGSWKYTFTYHSTNNNITVAKGSICINGVSLTVVDSKKGQFSVAIIPYTYEHTNFRTLQKGDTVNLEFDILGKYINQYLALYLENSKT
jgi:riboflavin synthase